MSAFAESKERIRGWSWPMKLAALAAVAIILFLAWDSYVKPLAHDWDIAATGIEKEVDEIYRASMLASDLSRKHMREPVTTLGPVTLPPREAEERLFELVSETADRHGVRPSISKLPRAKLPKSVLTGITHGANRIERLTADVKFDARPEAAIAIIADLESIPEIQAVTSVRMVRDVGGRLKVHLIVESWVISSEADTGAAA